MITDTEIDVRPLQPELLSDYLAFFDRDAFADNPRWASCYCFFNHTPRECEPWDERTGAQNRADAASWVAAGRMRGYLAYSRGKVVGWCNANLRASYTNLDADPELARRRVGAITCFVIAKACRGRGIARRLLAAACAGFEREGMDFIEAYPRKDANGEAANYHGPLAMYLAAGFVPVAENQGVVVVRKRLEVSA